MAVLSLDPDYLRRLVLKVRAFMGKEDTEVPEATVHGSAVGHDPLPTFVVEDWTVNVQWRRHGNPIAGLRVSSTRFCS